MTNKPLEKKGDRIVCTFFNASVNNSDPKTKVLEPSKGDVGTVVDVKHIKNLANYGEGYWQIWIKWDSHNKEFPLIWGYDGFEKLHKYKNRHNEGSPYCIGCEEYQKGDKKNENI